MSERVATQATPAQALAQKPESVLRRKCACGSHTIGGSSCDKCRESGSFLQRSARTTAAASSSPTTAPAIVQDVLNSPGHALDSQTRTLMEAGFSSFGQSLSRTPRAPQLAGEEGLAIGAKDDPSEHEAERVAAHVALRSRPNALGVSPARYDFSRVRVHTGQHAAESASSVNALAFTVGEDIVFGSGQYAPATNAGRALLAHELTHVVQQGPDLRPRALQRSVGGFLTNILSGVPVFGFLFRHSQKELQAYLKKLDETGQIEDDWDSDDKALRIAESWNSGASTFVLTARRKALLILEMLSGWVAGDEQGAIIGLLERSDNPDLKYIFGEGGVKHEKLLSELGSRKEELYRFYQRRFPSAYPDQSLQSEINAPPTKPDVQKLNAAEPGGSVVQPGDKLPETSNPYYSSVRSKETKRRTDVVSMAEADAWLMEVYGQYLPEDKKKKPDQKKGYAEANVKLKEETGGPDDQFESAFYDCFNRIPDEQRRIPAERSRWESTCRYEAEHAAAFFNREDKEIYVRTDRESPSTRLHEVVHAYSHDTVDQKLTRYAREGLTEYITRQIIIRHRPTKKEKRLAFSQSYGGPYDLMLELSLIVGETALAKAHFQGDVESVARVIGEPVFAQVLTEMENRDGAQAAIKILRQSRAPKKGKAQKKAAGRRSDESKRRSAKSPLFGAEVSVGAVDDHFEAEADAVAERVMRSSVNETGRGAPQVMSEREAVISRKPEAEASDPVSNQSHEGIGELGGSGKALSPRERAFFEPRFGQDFSQVRVHTGARATESARALDALAYTLGSDIVFNEGLYQPGTQAGDHLLAHELTHVVQQRGGGHEGKTLRRKGGSFTGFWSKFGRSIASIFGRGEGFSEETLQGYLQGLDKDGIEDDFDSDFKARAVVRAWRVGGSPYVLTEQRKALLIREMQKGATGDDDEMSILEILERSYNFELSYIFGAGGVSVSDLNSDFHGDEWDRLKDFYNRRFQDTDAMIKGTVSKPVGYPVPLGEGLPLLGSGWMTGDDLPGAKSEWNVPCVLGLLCSEDKAVVSQLPQLRVQKADKVTEVYWEFDGSSWQSKTRERGAFSNADLKTIGLKKSANCPTAAEHIIHEVHHQGQPETWTGAEKERDAYTFAEEWSIKRGLPGKSALRTKKPNTNEETPDAQAIEKYVADRYSGATAGAPGSQIIDHTPAGKTLVVMSPGQQPVERDAQPGDSHQDVDKTKANLDGLPKVDPKEWVCPVTK